MRVYTLECMIWVSDLKMWVSTVLEEMAYQLPRTSAFVPNTYAT